MTRQCCGVPIVCVLSLLSRDVFYPCELTRYKLFATLNDAAAEETCKKYKRE